MMDCPEVTQPTVTVQWPEHGDYLTKGIVNFFRKGYQVDASVTFAGTELKVHRLILAIFLPTFKRIQDSCNDPLATMNFDYVADSLEDVRALIEFAYTGQATVAEDRVDRLGRLAEDLSFDGLSAAIAGHRYRSNILEPDCQMDPVDICNAVLVKEDSNSQECVPTTPATIDRDQGEPVSTQYASLINICDIKKEPDRESTWTSLTTLELPTGTDDSTLFDDTPCGVGGGGGDGGGGDEEDAIDELQVVQPTPMTVDGEISLYNGRASDGGGAGTVHSQELNQHAEDVEDEESSGTHRYSFDESTSHEAIDYSSTGGGEQPSRSPSGFSSPCLLCGVEFEAKLDLRLHYSLCHPHNKLYMFECDKCDFFTVEQAQMIRHMPTCRRKLAAAKAEAIATLNAATAAAVETGDPAQPPEQPPPPKYSTGKVRVAAFACDLCHKYFANRLNVVRHVLSVHEGQRPFHCSFCPKEFKRKSHLQRHVEVMHEPPDGQDHKCCLCGKDYTTRTKLLKHARRVHKITQLDLLDGGGNGGNGGGDGPQPPDRTRDESS